MKKLLAFILSAIMFLSFAACGKGGEPNAGENYFENEINDDNSEGYIDAEETTYPILFMRDSSLYWIKEYKESPILVDEGDYLDDDYNVIVNPVNPNKIICFDEGLAHELSLNTAPNTDSKTIFSVWSEYYFFVVDTFYAPNGKVCYYDSEQKIVLNNTDINFQNIGCTAIYPNGFDDAIYYPYYCFDDSSTQFCYISNQNEIGYGDIETGWNEIASLIPSQYENISYPGILDYSNNKMFFQCVDNNQRVLCCFNFDTNTFEIIDSTNYYFAYSDESEVYIYSNESDFIVSIKNKIYNIDLDGDKLYSLKIVELDDETILLAYSTTTGKNNKVIFITDKKVKTILDDSKYQFIQPLSNNKLLLWENTETGTVNLVEYNIDNNKFSIIYENFKGKSEDIVITYNTYKWIFNYSYNSSDIYY